MVVEVNNIMPITDYYSQLSSLTLNQVLPESLVKAATDHGQTNYNSRDVKVFTLPSSVSSNPHIIYLNNQNLIQFLQLTIPTKVEAIFRQELSDRGELGLTRLPKTRSEVMYAYPESGIAYITNDYNGQVLRIQKFTPKSSFTFEGQEGKNFQPVLQPTPIAIQPTPTPTPTSPSVASKSITFIFILLIVGLAILVTLKRRQKI
jgi:hypothetical protein